ncbi:MAG: hypothetical protein QW295_04180, partial [Thermoplasmata archaeon]
MDIDEIVNMMKKSLPDETLFTEVIREIIKDELKSYIVEVLDKNPEIKKEIRASIRKYTEAKMKEVS